MPNYYIQATRGHFNPLSFDELVKPLNMYKEYYDENEKAVTEMRSQADLWEEIMKSEGDTDLANKYSQYSQGLNDAAQQLSNGMSYNLRKQIQDLRAKSAMVKQIENAYNLRAKDIDTYNELMFKDPSRIGAFDPSQRSLNDYMRGPVTNEYGVSGDRLYSLGNARAKAMSAQKDVFEKPASVLGKQYFELKEKTGYSDEEITQMLKEHNPEIFNEIDRIIQQEGTSLNNASDLNRAETYVLNGMLSGFTFNEDRKYLKDDSYMNEMDIANLQGKKLDNALKQLEINKKYKDLLGIEALAFFESWSNNDVELFKTNLPNEFEKTDSFKMLKKAIGASENNREQYKFDNNGTLQSKNSDLLNLIKSKIAINPNEDIDSVFNNDIEYYLNNKNPQMYYTQSAQGAPGAYTQHKNPDYDAQVNKINNLKKKYSIDINGVKYDINDVIDIYNKYNKDKKLAEDLFSLVTEYNIPGNSPKEKMENLYNFYNESAQIKNHGGIYFNNETEENHVEGVLKKKIQGDTSIKLKDNNLQDLSESDVKKVLKDNFLVYPSNSGFMIVKDNNLYYVDASSNDDINNYNKDLLAFKTLIVDPFTLVKDSKPKDSEADLRYSLSAGEPLKQIGDSNIQYMLYKDNNGDLFAYLYNRTTGGEDTLKLYDVNAWNKFIEKQVKAESTKILSHSSN